MVEHLTGPCDENAIWERVQAGIKARNRTATTAQRVTQLNRLGGGLHRWAAAAFMLIGVSFGATEILSPDDAQSSIIVESVNAFEAFGAGGGILDFTANHPDKGRRWMAARVDFTLPSDISAPEGLQITGSRLCSFLN